MNRFIEECRREWKRLRVPDLVADEMAADLAADLEEAESEGVSAEELLGASDARSFAVSWAAERSVIPPPRGTARLRARSLVLTAIAALTVIAAIGAALVLFASPDASPTAVVAVPPEFAAPRAPATITAIRVPPPSVFAGPRTALAVWIKPDGRGVVLAQANDSGVELNNVGSILLIVGIVGIIVTMPVLFRWRRRV